MLTIWPGHHTICVNNVRAATDRWSSCKAIILYVTVHSQKKWMKLTPWGKKHAGFITVNLNGTDWHIVSDKPEQPNTGTQPNIDPLKKARLQPHHQKNKLLNATIFLSEDSWQNFLSYKHMLCKDELSRIVGAQLLERIQKDIIFPNETHFLNEVGHGKWVCKSYFVLIMF